jgi:signal transduction histidine kinase
VARTLADELRGLAETSDHPLELRLEDGVLAIADEERVLQIGRALAGNALQHTPAGTTVRLRVERRYDRATLAVEDDGPGIPAEDRERVFERFHRVEGRLASGSGLGLAIARELAALMDGELRLDSPPGRTAFTLELPLAREPAPPAPVFT